ncbi:MAG: hypothetical protein K6T66_09885 [Peptococcaceae bacterium]|nr:hypothetical protein [Peptococcaceae bacterium]
MENPARPGPAAADPAKKTPAPEPDETARLVPVGEITMKEASIRDLPLFIVITGQVFDVDLPQKEFPGEDEFEEYLRRYAGEKFDNPAQREKFIKKHLETAIYMEDEIRGERAWEISGELQFKNARACGFGILKTQSKQFYMFQTGPETDLPSQLAAFQALTYGRISGEFLPLFASGESRNRLKSVIGPGLYARVMEALGFHAF